MRNRWLVNVVVCLTLLVMGPVWSGVRVGAVPAQQTGVIELVYGQTIDGQLDSTQPSVFYAFNASSGDVVTVAMIATGGTIDPFLVLNDAAQSPLATDDNSGGDRNARLTFVIPADGRYIIQATNSGGIPPSDGGTFSLNLTAAVNGEPVVEATPEPAATEIPVEAIPAPTTPPDNAPPDTSASDSAVQGDSTRLIALTSGTTVRDTLDRQTAVRYYWFEGGEGDQISVTPEQVAAFKPLIVLYNGNFEEQQRVAPGIGMQATLRNSGVFFLAVSLPDAGQVGGEYGFIFGLSENLAASANFEAITYGQSVQGMIDATTPSVTYSLQGTAGDTITVMMSRASGDLDSYLYLLDEAGQLLFEDNDSGGENGNARMVYTLPANGTYLITATRLGQAQGTTSGGFLLDVISNAAPPVASGAIEPTAEPTPLLPADYAAFPQIAYGETVEGELSDAKFMDIYVFYGEAGDTITAEMVSQNKDEYNALDPLLVLLDDARIPLAE
ncbi:MAG: PPC domain-containing protein, partial [Anaerolineae bacterium]|nr:PPC domain-containing protein [Anaerolineae bacterium]